MRLRRRAATIRRLEPVGFIFGFAVAVGASLSYFFSRQWVSVRRWSLKQLLVISHVWMGGAAAVALVWMWPANMPDRMVWLRATFAVVIPYLGGQLGTVWALRFTDASRIAPLLGVKIVMVAVMSMLVFNTTPAPLQWLAVALAVGSAFMLNRVGGSMPWQAVVGTLAAATCYTFSDLGIKLMNNTLEPVGDRGPLIGAALAYTAAGIGAVALLPWLGSRQPRRWLAAVPYAASWLGSVACLFVAVSMLGLVLAVIMQSLRGIVAVILGAMIVWIGHHALEANVTRSVWVRRAIAAIMMTAAIALYVYVQSP